MAHALDTVCVRPRPYPPLSPGNSPAVKILLTGGAGYIGSACLRWLLRNGHDPIAYDDMLEGNAASVPDGRLVVGDIRDTDKLAATLRAARGRGGDALRGPGVGPAVDRRPGRLLLGERRRDQERPRRDAAGRASPRSSSAARRRPMRSASRCRSARPRPSSPRRPTARPSSPPSG